jgi:hypothetical protein
MPGNLKGIILKYVDSRNVTAEKNTTLLLQADPPLRDEELRAQSK